MQALLITFAPYFVGVVGALVGGSILGWLLKKIPIDAIKVKLGIVFFGLGATLTLGLAKWSKTKKVWNSVLEPWVIVVLETLIIHSLSEFIRGMKSDNPMVTKIEK